MVLVLVVERIEHNPNVYIRDYVTGEGADGWKFKDKAEALVVDTCRPVANDTSRVFGLATVPSDRHPKGMSCPAILFDQH